MSKRNYKTTLLALILTATVTALCTNSLPIWAAVGNPPQTKAASSNAKDLFFVQLKHPTQTINNGFVYTLELHRGKEPPRFCSHQADFFSGDGLRVHVKSNFTGYAYIVLAQGSTGNRTVLYPPKGSKAADATSPANLVTGDKEYVLPEGGLIRFDNNPGTERLLFILSREPIDQEKLFSSGSAVSVNKALESGQTTEGLSISTEAGGTSSSGATYVVKTDPTRAVYAEVALKHISSGAPATPPVVITANPPATPAPPPSNTSVTPSSSVTGTPPATGPVATSTPPAPSVPSLPSVTQPPETTPPASLNRPVTDKWAVIVALSKYKESCMNLKAPRKDAEAFANFLINDAGFAPSHVIRIYDKEATREKILAALAETGQSVRPDDLFVFFANCHGSANTETPGNFLLLYDYTGERSMKRQLLMQDLSDILKSKVPSQRIVIIVQACHSGYVKAGAIPSAQAVSDDLMGVGRIIATACTGVESSWVYGSGGIFTRALIPNLRKYPKLKEALTRTQADVIAETESGREGRQMHPVIKYDLWLGDDAVLMAKPVDPRP